MERYNCGIRELKVAASDSGDMTFSGYGAVFGNVDWYGDMIKAGAFADTLKEAKDSGQWPAMLLQHGMTADMDVPIGVWLEMKEDSIGLFVEGKLADTEKGREAYALMKMEPRPAINGLSIGYIPQEWENRAKPEDPRRTLKKVSLVEISLVTFPANGSARVNNVKSQLSIRDAERALRDAGFSRTESKTILSEGFKSLPLRDADGEGCDELAALLRRNIQTISK